MPQISNLSFNVSFEPHNPNRVGLTNTTSSLPAGFVGIFKVTQPDGYVRNGDINTPDVTNVVSSCVVTLVPDSAGQLQQGQYIIELIGNAPGYLSTSFIRTFTLQYTAATISLRNDFDVFTPQLAYTDISNYNVSGYTISSGPTRKWDATSATTGTISGTNSSIDIKYNNQYYAETYTIQFEVNVAYVSQAYPWLTITHTRTQSTTVTACIPKSLEDLTQAVEALREESNASCGGDWAKFEKANALYAHLLNMLRLVLIAGQHQDGFFDVYQQLLTYIQNGSVACDSIGQVIPPYDFSDYESSIYDGQSSYCQLVGDGVNTVYRVNHQLGDQCVVVQVYEVATGKQVFCDLAVSTINSIDITFYEPPTLNQYRVVAVAGALGLRGQGFQPGGLTGQILRKKTNADFDTEWADVAVALPLLVPYTGATQSVYLGEHGIEAGFVRLDTTPTTTPSAAAVMSWNDTDGTADLRLKGNNVTLQIGQEMVARVVNKTGANLLGSQYKAVRVRKVSEGGAQGQRLAVVLAQANTEFLSTDMLGVVTENIDNNQEGFITTFGAIKNIDTTGALQGEVWSDGDILFLSPTVPGGLTKVKPSAPNHLSIVGYVEYAHQNNGKIFIHVQTSWELDELHNVSITNPVNNQVLKYNGTLWVNSTIPAVTSVGLATATSGVTITDTPVTSSGVININIATASSSSNGLLSSADWATFNAKQSALTFGSISTATSGVTITNGNASTVGPNVSISIATAGSGQNGLLSAADWATFNAKQSAITLTTTGNSGAATFVGSTLNIPNYTLAGLGGVPATRSLTINGTAYDLSADRTWSVGTVTSVAALTIGTAGTDISSTVATGTTTPVITLNIPTASSANRGALSAADWETFNNKQNAITLTTTGTSGAATLVGSTLNIPQYQSVLTNPVTGTGTTNYIPKFTAGSTIGNSQIFDNGTNVGIGTASPSVQLQIGNGSGLKQGYISGGGYDLALGASGGSFLGFASQAISTIFNTSAVPLGIGTNASQPLLLGTANLERLRITSGGNVGIGTTSPNGKLDVANAGDVAIWATATSAGSAALYLYPSGGGVAQIASVGAVPLQLLTNGSEKMRIFANGRIGINTTTDAGYQLDVNGTARINNALQVNKSDGGQAINIVGNSNTASIQQNGSDMYFNSNTNTTGGGFFFRNSSSFTTRMAIDASGNVLIGANTASSNGLLQVNGSIGLAANSQVRQSVNTDGGTLQFFGTQFVASNLNSNSYGYTGGAFIASVTNNDNLTPFEAGRIASTGGKFKIVNTTSENTYISLEKNAVTTLYANTSNGNVGIGTASPANKLSINGAANALTYFLVDNSQTYLGDNGVIGGGAADGNTALSWFSTKDLYFKEGSSTRMTIKTGGNVGIGTASPLEVTNYTGLTLAGTNGSFTSLYTGASQIARIEVNTTSDFTVKSIANVPLILGTNNTENVRITTSGNVGIGLIPAGQVGFKTIEIGGTGVSGLIDVYQGTSRQLRIYNSSTDSYVANNANGGWMIFRTTTSGGTQSNSLSITDASKLLVNTSTDAGDYKLQVSGNVLADFIYLRNNTAALVFGTNSAVNPYVQGTSGNALALGTSNNPRIWITSDGSVGVGTTSPTQRLDVSGYAIAGVTDRTLIGQDGTYTGYSTVGFGGVGNGSNRVFGSSSSADGLYLAAATGRGITFRVNGTDIASMFINSLGNVGIGTTSPNQKMTIQSGVGEVAGITFRANNLTSSDEVFIGQGSAGSLFLSNRSTNAITFQIGGFTKMNLTNDAKLFINTTTDAGDYKLQVSGNALVTAGKLDITTNTAFGLSIQRSGTSVVAGQINNSSGILYYGAESSTGGSLFTGSSAYAAVIGSGAAYPLELATNNIVRASISSAGVAKINDLAGSGTRMVVADSSGVLSTQAIPSGGGGSSTLSFNRQTASYTIVSGDVGKVVEMNVGTANNATIPTNATASIAVGSQITIAQYGSGQTTIVAAVGVTLRATNNWLKISAQYGAATLVKVATDEWYVVGNLSA